MQITQQRDGRAKWTDLYTGESGPSERGFINAVCGKDSV